MLRRTKIILPVCNATTADPHFLAVDDPLVAIFFCPRLDGRHIRACTRFRHTVCLDALKLYFKDAKRHFPDPLHLYLHANTEVRNRWGELSSSLALVNPRKEILVAIVAMRLMSAWNVAVILIKFLQLKHTKTFLCNCPSTYDYAQMSARHTLLFFVLQMKHC